MNSTAHDNGKFILVCVDSMENGSASGRFYPGSLDDERPFHNLNQFLVNMDRIMDGDDCAVAPAVENAGTVWYTGKVATFKVRVMFRQNGSWQGSVMWLETRHEEKFRSAMELLAIFHQALIPSQEKRMRPSSLKIASSR